MSEHVPNGQGVPPDGADISPRNYLPPVRTANVQEAGATVEAAFFAKVQREQSPTPKSAVEQDALLEALYSEEMSESAAGDAPPPPSPARPQGKRTLGDLLREKAKRKPTPTTQEGEEEDGWNAGDVIRRTADRPEYESQHQSRSGASLAGAALARLAGKRR